MASWQRGLRLGLGVFILLFAVGLYFSLRPSSRRSAVPPGVAKVDPKAVVQGAKGTFLISKGVKLDIRADYDMLFTYPDGTNKLVGVVARVPERSGRDFTLRAREATVGAGQADIGLTGAVELESSDGLSLKTDAASFQKDPGVVRAPGAVAFARARMSGTSAGMTYDQGTDTLTLLRDAVIHIAPDETGGGGADIQSGSAIFARRDKHVRFEQGVTIVRAGQTTTADQAIAYLTDDEKSVKLFALRGSSRVSGAGGGAGGLQGMIARDIDLYYAPDGQVLQQAVLTGGGSIDLAGATAAAPRRLAAEWIDVGLAPDGTTVTTLAARDRVQLDLPAESGTPARVIRSATLQGTGEPGKGLTAATFGGGAGQVEFREMPPSAAPRVARSGTMDLALQNGFNSIESARFGGGVRFEEGDLAAVSRDARYVLAKGALSLSGNHPRTGQPPQVIEEQATIEARTIEIGLEGRKIAARDMVKSDLRPRKGSEGNAAGRAGRPADPAKAPTRLPSMLKQDEPVSATSDSLDYDTAASHAVYTGHAQLWQGETTIKAERITLDDQKGDLSASGSVVTTMTLEQVNEKTKARDKVHSVANAAEMVYQDDIRRATYTTGAHMTGPQGDLRADKIELYLKEGGSEVERLEGYGTVALQTPEGRKATGKRLTYFGDEERYVMTGAPVRITEECRETTGKTLTFFRSADRIIVDGNEQKRTETKGGSACGSAPRSSD